MKNKKRVIIPLIVILFLGMISVLLHINSEAIDDKIDEWYWKRKYRLTKERYTALLLDHQEDFDYVAETMKQWDHGEIYFEDGIKYSSKEIKEEVENNEEFKHHLENLNDLGEIFWISRNVYPIGSRVTVGTHGWDVYGIQLYYHEEGVEVKTVFNSHEVNENWVLVIYSH